MNPSVDLFIPVYKVEPFIEKCLTSVLSQEYDNMRIVLIDDASPDKSIEIVKRVIQEKNTKGHQIEIVRCKKNGGLGATRLIAHQMINGKYTLFLDSDDYWDNDKVVSEWVAIAEKGNYKVVITDYCHEYPTKNISIPQQVNKIKSGKEFTYALLKGTESGFVWNKLFLSSELKKYTSFVKEGRDFWEDMAIVIPFLYSVERIGYYSKISIHYQHHGNQYTAKTKPDYIDTLKSFLEDLERFFPLSQDKKLQTALAFCKLRVVYILAELPFKYYKELSHPVFHIKGRKLLPSGMKNSIMYLRHYFIVHRISCFLGWLLVKLTTIVQTLKRKKSLYRI